MNPELRNRRLRQLVRKTNIRYKKQAQQIDILCNEIIGAQRNFIRRLEIISFAGSFYRSIIGQRDLGVLFSITEHVIKEEIGDSHVSFFLRRDSDYELYTPQCIKPSSLNEEQFESCFNFEIVENICNANKICRMEDLLAAGMQVKPTWIKTISAVTIALGNGGISAGFILIYCEGGNKLNIKDLLPIASITEGLTDAIGACTPIEIPG